MPYVTYLNPTLRILIGLFLTTIATGDTPAFGQGETEVRVESYGIFHRTFLDLHGSDEYNLWSVGEDGIVFHSGDQGTTWEKVNVGKTGRLTQVFFATEQKGWIIGGGAFLKTEDGGETWESFGPSWPTQIQFIDDQLGWRSISDNIQRTSDGGDSWSTIAKDVRSDLFQFVSETIGFAWVGNSSARHLLKTSDGGKNWTELDTNFEYSINDFHFINENEGWVVGPLGMIYKTPDGGQNWISLAKPELHWSIDSVRFFDSQIGILGAYNGRIYRTEDGGETFELIEDLPTSLTQLEIASESLIFIVGSGGVLARSNNKGTSWEIVRDGIGSRLDGIAFIDQDLGWGTYDTDVYKTTNGGGNWTLESLPNSANSKKLFAINNTVYAISNSGSKNVWKWTRQSGNWTKLSIPNNISIAPRSVHFSSDTRGWLVGDNGAIVSTNDGGITWNPQSSHVAVTLEDVFFLNDQEGWATGVATLIHTLDGGATWNELSVGTFDFFRRIHATDSESIWVAGNNVFHSENGGISWEQIDWNGQVEDLYFLDKDTGFIGSQYDTILTTDGGESWSSLSSDYYRNFAPFSSTEMYAIGSDFAKIGIYEIKTPQEINKLPDQFIRTNEEGLTVLIESTSGLTVTLSSSNPDVASVNGSTIVPHSEGKTTISANQGGNATYEAAEPSRFRVTVVGETEDTDGDQATDAWEIEHGFNRNVRDLAGDKDGDGRSNLAEYVDKTDPNDKNSFFNFRLIDIRIIDISNAQVTFTAVPSLKYTLEYSTDLTTNKWENAAETVASENEQSLIFPLSISPEDSTVFFRIATPHVE